ncbi:hypothetical protein [Candidatus Allofournierella excrementigallinarum]|uniref:hypothetical protein n=1 Tax=Candidatus Allofournierella excrementigallinarum TaxID=2838592 RepID=UPI00374EA7B7
MKPFLVDVPVVIYLWIRPQLQRETFAPVCEARPSTLFLISDGGRNEAEWEKIYESRRIVESMIDWDCKVYKLYEEKNNGMYAMMRKTNAFVFAVVDRAIVFEDDTIADPSYYAFCAELLEKYKDDLRIQGIAGRILVDENTETPYDYFFSGYMGPGTGDAVWKRTTQIFDTDDWLKEPYYRNGILRMLPGFKTVYKQLDVDGRYDGHLPGSEFYYALQKRLEGQLCICAKKNMVRQMGATDDATHGVEWRKLDKKTQRAYVQEVHPCTFPLKHPPYVMRDVRYDATAKKISGSKLELQRRKFVTRCKRLWYGDGILMWKSFVKRYIKRDIREN